MKEHVVETRYLQGESEVSERAAEQIGMRSGRPWFIQG